MQEERTTMIIHTTGENDHYTSNKRKQQLHIKIRIRQFHIKQEKTAFTHKTREYCHST